MVLLLNSTSPQSLECSPGNVPYFLQKLISIPLSIFFKAAISVYLIDSMLTCSHQGLKQKGRRISASTTLQRCRTYLPYSIIYQPIKTCPPPQSHDTFFHPPMNAMLSDFFCQASPYLPKLLMYISGNRSLYKVLNNLKLF